MFSQQRVKEIRSDFPMFKNNDAIYLDSAATTFKPQSVIDTVVNYYTHQSYNVGRSDYLAAFNVEAEVNKVRAKVAKFINADSDEIIFTSGATASLNLVAFSYGLENLSKDDVILTTMSEHASNILPWFKVADMTNAKIEYVDLDKDNKVSIEAFRAAMHSKVKIVSIAAISNVLGISVPIKEIVKIAHEYNAIVVCDGAQSVPHMLTDVKDSNVDFLAFSGHKMLAPTGVGVLYGKAELLKDMPAFFQGGGSNARYSDAGVISYKKAPAKFENGTMAIESILGLGAAIDYINDLNFEAIIAYEKELAQYLLSEMLKLDNIEVYNPKSESGIVSFNVKGIFSQDVSTYLDTQKVQVRSGHHCSKIFNQVIGANDTVRASIYFYNTYEEVDKFIEVLKTTTIEKCINLFV